MLACEIGDLRIGVVCEDLRWRGWIGWGCRSGWGHEARPSCVNLCGTIRGELGGRQRGVRRGKCHRADDVRMPGRCEAPAQGYSDRLVDVRGRRAFGYYRGAIRDSICMLLDFFLSCLSLCLIGRGRFHGCIPATFVRDCASELCVYLFGAPVYPLQLPIRGDVGVHLHDEHKGVEGEEAGLYPGPAAVEGPLDGSKEEGGLV